jgi:VanZ family protein
MIHGSSCRGDNFPVTSFRVPDSAAKRKDDDTMTKASIPVFRAALCVSLIAISILSVIPLDYPTAAGINDKLSHIIAFYILSLLADFSFPETKPNLAKILPLLFYGLSIEWVQYYIPYREFSLFDLAADAAGLLAYGLSLPILKHIPLLRFRWDFYKNT